MLGIKPLDVNDCLKFIRGHREDIERGMCDLEIQKEWVASLSETDLLLLAKHCSNSRRTIAQGATADSVLQVLARDESYLALRIGTLSATEHMGHPSTIAPASPL